MTSVKRWGNRVLSILLDPKREWPVIDGENAAAARVFVRYLLPLSLIPALAAILGGYLAEGAPGLVPGLRQALFQLAALLAGASLTAWIVNALAEKHGSVKDMNKAFALVAYAYTPECLGGIAQLIPPLAPLGSLVGLYSLYLLYTGLPPLMKTPEKEFTGYFTVSLLCLLCVFVAVSFLLGPVILGTSVFG
ncbi:MAG: YIP1 family protein [Candidatus Accumulibacter sp.]|jgi:hypothetical protein|nr:YIP1 family protein [Accumulibacter sp.]